MNHLHIGDNSNNVALIYHHLHEYEKAFSLFQRSSQIHGNDYEQKMRIPICLNNIGVLYLDQHQYDQAIEYYFKALDMYNKENEKDKYQEGI
jgi:tetratricopeptide (TPR) repeat protein